jgi:hypothetical protein
MLKRIHTETFGATDPSLKALRDEIMLRFDHRLSIIEALVKEDDINDTCKGYGFVIFDADTEETIIIGDGFRADGGGEGGQGHRAAQALLRLMGLHVAFSIPIANFSESMTLSEIPVDVMREFVKIPIQEKPDKHINYLFARCF